MVCRLPRWAAATDKENESDAFMPSLLPLSLPHPCSFPFMFATGNIAEPRPPVGECRQNTGCGCRQNASSCAVALCRRRRLNGGKAGQNVEWR